MNSRAYAEIATKVVTRGAFNQQGQMEVLATGDLNPLVDVLKGPNISRNSSRKLPNGKYELPFGPAWTLADFLDSTSSFSPFFKPSFLQMGPLNAMVKFVNKHCNPQTSGGFIQDYRDRLTVGGEAFSRRIAIMQTKYEADAQKLLEQLQMLMPSNAGADPEEDYLLMFLQLLFNNEADCLRYGIQPTAFLTGDEIGRESIDTQVARDQLGINASVVLQQYGIDLNTMTAAELGHLLISKVNFFFIYVRGDLNDSVATWWKKVLGKGRVVCLNDAEYGAALKAALVYVTHKEKPTRKDVVNFLVEAGDNSHYPVSASVAGEIYDSIVRAGVAFGTQIPVVDLPKPGDIFDHPRNPFPEGHELYVPYQELGLPDPESGTKTPFTPIIASQLAYVIDEKTKKPRKVTGTGSPSVGPVVETHTVDTDYESDDFFVEDESDDDGIDWTEL